MADRYDGKRVTVMGLGRFSGGVSAARWLASQGAAVTVTDQLDGAQLAASVKQLADLPIELHLGGHQDADFTDADLIVVNPAVPKDSPYLQKARAAGVRLTAEMNLFFQRCAAPIIGVTGTNGKSTTAAMIAHLLMAADQQRRVWLGGNIGQSLLEKLPQIGPDDRVVLELSSFQLEDLGTIRRSPHLAVVTNLSANHLDRHGTFPAYLQAKRNIVRFQGETDYAVFYAEQPELQQWSRRCRSRCIFFDAPSAPFELQIPGRCNQLNAAAALACCKLLGIESTASLRTFKGLPHRLEYVGRIDGVRFYNDSKSTTPASTMAALAAFTEPRIVIVGGYDKGVPLGPLIEALHRESKGVVCMGQTAVTFLEGIQRRRIAMDKPHVKAVRDLDGAFRMAAHWARPGEVVLLSPGCASYDQFTNFEDRGRQFHQLVQQFAR